MSWLVLWIGCATRQPATPPAGLAPASAPGWTALSSAAPAPEDLAALDRWFEGRRVVAVGESSHGTHELFLLQAALFRYAVERHGVRVLALELPAHTGAAIDAWIQGGPGPLRPLLQGVWYWLDCREILALLTWMREQRQRGVPLSVVGVDPQVAAGSAAGLLEALPSDDHSPLWRAIVEQRLATLPELERVTEEAWERLEDEPSADRHRALAAVAQAADVARWCTSPGCHAVKRDLFLASNVLTALERRGAGVFVWAHNDHVSHQRADDGWAPMGWHLRQALGPALLTVGLDFGQGTLTAPTGRAQGALPLEHLGGFLVAGHEVSGADPRTLGGRYPQAHPALVATTELSADVHLHAYGAFVPGSERSLSGYRAVEAFDLVGLIPDGSALQLLP